MKRIPVAVRIYLAFFLGLMCIVAVFIITGEIEDAGSYAHITDIVYKAEVVDEPGSDGKVRITERLTFDVHASNSNPDNLIWELWRDLPEEDADGVPVYYNVLSVKRLTVDGQPDELVFEKAADLYWEDRDYTSTRQGYGPNRWYHSEGPFDDYKNFECVLFYVDGLYRETVVFELEYEMYNASMRYADCSELYLSVFSGGSVNHLNSLSAQILIPEDKMPDSGNYDAHTYGTNAHTFDFTSSDTLNPDYFTFAFDLDKSQLSFRPYNEYVEFVLVSHGDDKHKFTEYASVNDRYNENIYQDILKSQEEYENLPAVFTVVKWVLFGVFILLAALAIALVFLLDRRVKNKYGLYTPKVGYKFYREIPAPLDPAFAGAFALCKNKLSDDVPGGYAAAMLGLVKKGYIDVTRVNETDKWTPKNTKITIKYNNDIAKNKDKEAKKAAILPELPALLPSEESYFNLIRKHATTGIITLSGFEKKVFADYQNTNTFVSNTKKSVTDFGVSAGYFRETKYKKLKVRAIAPAVLFIIAGLFIMLLGSAIASFTRLDLAFGAFFILGGGIIAAAVIRLILSKKYVLLTQSGEDEYAKWRGLYNFLNSETLIKERTVLDVSIWEDYLIYATAFGISEKVIKALKVRFPEYDAHISPIVRHPYLCYHRFTHTASRSFGSGARTSASIGRSGGGSYGGGGRGGGGGGGGS